MIYGIEAGLLKFCPQCGGEFVRTRLAEKTKDGAPIVCERCGCCWTTTQDKALRILANRLRQKQGQHIRLTNRRFVVANDRNGGFDFLVMGKKSYEADYKATYPTLADAIIAAIEYGIPFQPKKPTNANES